MSFPRRLRTRDVAEYGFFDDVFKQVIKPAINIPITVANTATKAVPIPGISNLTQKASDWSSASGGSSNPLTMLSSTIGGIGGALTGGGGGMGLLGGLLGGGSGAVGSESGSAGGGIGMGTMFLLGGGGIIALVMLYMLFGGKRGGRSRGRMPMPMQQRMPMQMPLQMPMQPQMIEVASPEQLLAPSAPVFLPEVAAQEFVVM